MDQADYSALRLRAIEGLRAKTSGHMGAWRLHECGWALNQEAGTIEFTRPDGIRATADVQIIATYDTTDQTLLWGWDHPSVRSPLDAHAQRLYTFGLESKIDALTTRKISCTEEEAWEYAALACEINDAQGAYRGPAGPTLVFMTFGTVTLSQGTVATEGGCAESAEEPSAAELVVGLQRVDRPDVIAFLQAYFHEMFQIEKAHHEQTDGARDDARCDALKRAIAAKKEVYLRTWLREDDYWEPSSVGWPSDYDWGKVSERTVYEITPASFRILYKLDLGWGSMEYAYDVSVEADGIRIVDFHF